MNDRNSTRPPADYKHDPRSEDYEPARRRISSQKLGRAMMSFDAVLELLDRVAEENAREVTR